ncbi:Os06g0527250 [Oryza sativa Japonica Group]|uniref:Uncharacterized protein n=2 Tax=Oryza sativa subsp. japonica TaxID=39947 RepID=A0A0P0WXC6_ORYSJ|nr:hypothetical protein [Oryza sativa Japonica Group]BAD54194.1 hypothetical protein [Oryza sativa Japonica Group]BAS98045.1 Os06g0527250 [Oryza sativa Japonica Group]
MAATAHADSLSFLLSHPHSTSPSALPAPPHIAFAAPPTMPPSSTVARPMRTSARRLHGIVPFSAWYAPFPLAPNGDPNNPYAMRCSSVPSLTSGAHPRGTPPPHSRRTESPRESRSLCFSLLAARRRRSSAGLVGCLFPLYRHRP